MANTNYDRRPLWVIELFLEDGTKIYATREVEVIEEPTDEEEG